MTGESAVLEKLMVHRLSIERREVREDSVGGQAERWKHIGQTIGRISQPASATPREERAALSLQEAAPYYVYVPIDAEIQRGDVLVEQAERPPGQERRLLVSSVVWPSVEVYHRVEVTDYQPEIPHRAPLEPEED